MTRRLYSTILVTALATALSGCDEDERIVQLSKEAADRQAQQNVEMARVTREASEANKEVVRLHGKLNQHHEQIAEERRAIASARRWDALTAVTIEKVGFFFACLVPIFLAAYVVRTHRQNTDVDDMVSEVLIEEILSENRKLLHMPSASRSLKYSPGDESPALVSDD